MPLIPHLGPEAMLEAFRAGVPGILLVIGVLAGLWTLGWLTSCGEAARPHPARKSRRTVMR